METLEQLHKQIRSLSFFDVQVFVYLGKYLNSKAVAAELEVLPSKVSRSLSAMRSVFNDKLFIRRQYNFEPSPLAVQLYPMMESVKSNLDRMVPVVMGNQGKEQRERQKVNLAVPATLSNGLTSYLLEAARQNGEEIDISLRIWSGSLNSDTNSDAIDLGVYFSAVPVKGAESEFIAYSKSTCVVAAKSHPLWQQFDRFEEVIFDYPFVVTECASFNDAQDPMEIFAKLNGRDLNIRARVNTLDELVSMLGHQDSFSFTGGRRTIEFLKANECLNVRLVPSQTRRRIHQGIGNGSREPGYYLTYKDRQTCPQWLLEALRCYIHDSLEVEDLLT
ncbi:DNA-binding transcriptional regulator, LysR family [Ferrimonas sediminum]|uniref:DNA-binding transcriptional regulator, LysR family n=1 Tax=Ferrimonas sediminum TaxID=718193 RepID=A0A1G8NSG6_9GAMM|nr:DNA-binding transcriptional regulator, LysR family [Ferrimonas sediminum]